MNTCNRRSPQSSIRLGLSLLSLSVLLVARSAFGSAIDLGTAGDYTVVALGQNFTIGQNSGPVVGNEILGNGVNAAFSGGGNGAITGTLSYDSTVTGTNTFSQLQNPPTTQLVSTAVTQGVLSAAQNASANAAALPATQSYASIGNGQVVNGNGGLNVINVGNINNANFTLNGNANDKFVFNISGAFASNQTMTLTGGVTASNILFNFTAKSGTVFQTSGGDTLYGTFLATDGGSFQFSNLNLTGSIINTDGNVQLVSGSHVSFPSIPETSSLFPLLGVLSLAIFGPTLRRKLLAARGLSKDLSAAS
jgi:hypothetical protein